MIRRTLLRASHPATSSLRASQRFASPTTRLVTPITRPFAFSPSSTRQAIRSYSEAAQAKTPEESAEKASEADGGDAKAAPSELDKLRTELEAKKKEVIDLKDKYLRSVADFRNLQERTKRETQSARDYAIQKFAKDLVAPIDNFEHALASVTADKLAAPPATASEESLTSLHKDLVSLHEGIKMIETVLLSTVEKHGLVRFDPSVKGEKFDPNIHEAVFMAPMAGKEDNTVFHTQQKGFMLNGRVIRAPKVGVVKNS